LKTKITAACGANPSKKGKGVKHGPIDVEKEQEITDNLGTVHINTRHRIRKENPYSFHERRYTGGDKLFWTETQQAMWDDFYSTKDSMKSGFIRVPKVLDTDHFKAHINGDFLYIHEALVKMDILDLVTLQEPIQSLAIRQFFCTVYFHNDPEESFTWMTGQDVHTATFADFCSALVYDGDRASGFKIHSQGPLATEKIVNIFYPEEPLHPAPTILGMYYYYNALAKLFRCNLVSKAGDDASVRGYHKNLLFYCQPTRLRKIHGCDFIFQEIKRTSMKHMTPNYC
jgi:hypothetical protein